MLSQRYLIRLSVAVLALAFAILAPAQNGGKEWIEMTARAIQQSKLTLPGSESFHLRAEIIESTNPPSPYRGTVEEFWVSPEKWRRTIESPGFSQTMVVNGDKLLEKDTGDYFPWWLRDMITAMFDPTASLEIPDHVSPRAAKPLDPRISSLCTTVNTSIDRWSICFEPRRTLLTSIYSNHTGYGAEFKNFEGFGKKQVPRHIVFNPESGTTIEATITQLDKLQQMDEKMFAIEKSTPPQDRITSVRISEDALRNLSLTNTNIDWPAVGGGLAKGGCAVYVSADRSGHMREVWPGGCDNAGLEDPLRDIVRKWQLKTAVVDGVPVQVESRLTFGFEAKVAPDPLPELSDAEARMLATKVVEPVLPPESGEVSSEYAVKISVDGTGKLAGVENIKNLATSEFMAVNEALSQWQFKPYIKDGKPQYFHAEIVFRSSWNYFLIRLMELLGP